jgi:murein L,D-transpeptidase YcbB/YkuD
MIWRAAITAILLILPGYSSAQPVVASSAVRAAAASVGDGGATSLFYEQRSFTLAWAAESDRRRAQAAMDNAAEDGLDPDRYRVPTSGDLVTRDVSMSAALLQYMRDLSIGRSDLERLDTDVALPMRSIDAPTLLDHALQERHLLELLASLRPPHAEYEFLRRALADHPSESTRVIINANMERLRWLPPVLEPDRIVVNAADAQLQMWLGGKLVLTSRVIVGRPSSPTPILRAEGAGITLNPSWTVPQSIAAREFLPKLKRNHAWLANNEMVLLNGPPGDSQGLHINWRSIPAGTFPYQVRQYPGSRNPLGRIKLELPNRFDVYLHDTPGKAAFAKSARQLSHGCVRVEQILPLASYALAGDLTAIQKITEAIGDDGTSYIPLRRKLPVYFLYWTALPGPDGALQFHPDVYGRDRRLIAAIRVKPLQVAAALPACPKG